MILMKEKLRLFAFICFFVSIGTDALFAQISLNLVPTFNGCNSTPSGFVNLSVSGGDGDYTYQWSTGSVAQDLFFVPAGTYSVTVLDGAGVEATGSVDIEEPDALILYPPNIDFNCVDSALVSLTVEGGVPPYDIQWSNGNIGIQNTLPSGNFSVSVYDESGCAAYYASEVPDSFYIDLIIFDESCNMECDGSIFTSVNGGSGPYTFEWEHGADSSYIFPLHADTFVVTVTEGSGCVAYGTGIVNTPDPILIDFISDTILCGGDPFADVSVDITGGFPPFSYLWSTGDVGPMVSDFPVDSMLTLTVFDSLGCFAQDTFFHNTIDSLTVDMNIFPDDCGGAPNGAIYLSITGGDGPFSYNWSNNSTGTFIYGLSAGDYSVTVNNDEGCSGTASGEVQIANSPLNAFIVATPPSDCLEEDGQIAVIMSGGVGPYTFDWSNGATGSVLSGLSQGIYTVTINDPLNCPIVEEVDLNVYSAIDVEIVGDNSFCEEGDSVYLEAMILDGVPPFEYSWNTGDTSLGIWVSEGGTYVFSVEDSLGCLGKDLVEVLDGSDLYVNLNYDGINCSGDANGIAWVNIYNEIGTPQILWSTGETGSVIENLEAGSYSVTVVDDSDCPQVIDFEIEEVNPLEFEFITEDVSCAGGSDGSVFVNIISDWTGLVWADGSIDEALTGLSAGTYPITILDSFLCELDTFVTILQPDILVVDIELIPGDCGSDSDSLTVFVSGGTGPYSYEWQDGTTEAYLSNVSSGEYVVLVTDANGCFALDSIIVVQDPDLALEFEVVNAGCEGIGGSINAQASGGNLPYTYLWNTGETTSSIEGLDPGYYMLTVCDAAGCCLVDSSFVSESEPIDIIVITEQVLCYDDSTGTASVQIIGGNGPFTIEWSTGNTGTEFISGLATGEYAVEVCDASNCCVLQEFIIESTPEMEVDINIETIPCFDQMNGVLSAQASGGFSNMYSYLWSNGVEGSDNDGLGEGVYAVTVQDINGCLVVDSIYLEENQELSYDVNILHACAGGATGQIEVFPDPATGAVNILWDNGSTNFVLDGLVAGDYSFTITDENGCILIGLETVAEDLINECQIEIQTQPSDCESADGSLIVVLENQSSTILWSTGATTAEISGLASGTYSVTVTDPNGCESVCDIDLDAYNSIGDFVWYDEDGDGVQDASEEGISGQQIILYNGSNQQLDQFITGADGWYTFDGLVDGQYYIYVQDTFQDINLTTLNSGNNDSLDSDVDPVTGESQLITLSGGICYEDLDVGYSDECVPTETPGSIGYDQQICGFMNLPEEIVEVTPATGGSQPYEYIWMYSYTYGPFNNGTWFPIPNSNSPNYQPGLLSHTTFFVRCVRSEGCENVIESNVVEIYVDPDIVANISALNYACLNEAYTLTAQENGPGVLYEWYLDGVQLDVPSDALTVVLSFGEVGYHEVDLIVIKDECTSYTTKTFYALDDVGLCGSAPNPGGDDQGLGFYTGQSPEYTFSVIPTLIEHNRANILLDGFSVKDVADIHIISTSGQYSSLDYSERSGVDIQFETESIHSGIYIMKIQLINGQTLSKKFVVVH